MGSSGSGRFSDYTGTPSGRSKGEDGEGGSDGGQNRCDLAIGDVELEEVGRSAYFTQLKTVPDDNSAVRLNESLISGRLAIVAADSGLVIGYLPTEYNYLRACMSDGYRYAGVVTSTVSAALFPRVWIDLAPEG